MLQMEQLLAMRSPLPIGRLDECADSPLRFRVNVRIHPARKADHERTFVADGAIAAIGSGVSAERTVGSGARRLGSACLGGGTRWHQAGRAGVVPAALGGAARRLGPRNPCGGVWARVAGGEALGRGGAWSGEAWPS